MSLSRSEDFPLEEIAWTDSAKSWSAGWYEVGTLIEQAKAWNGLSVTVGYVFYESSDVILLAQTLDNESDKIANVFLIYKPCIHFRRKLND